MGYILVTAAWTAALELLQTVLLGSRRTGMTLESVWNDQVQFVAQSVHVLTESHQPLNARLMGLCLLPLTVLIQMASLLLSSSSSSSNEPESSGSIMLLGTSLLYCGALTTTWWYWFLVLPFLMGWWITAAFVSGQCFALIEMAGV